MKQEAEMTPYVFCEVPEADIALFRKIKTAVEAMPDVDLGFDGGRKIVISCHMLTRALAEFFPVQVVDGYVFPIFEHSWLVTENRFIIDPYPPLVIGGPVLLVRDTRKGLTSPWKNAYYEHVLVNQAFNQEPFLGRVRLVAEVIRQTLENIGRP